MNGNAVNQMNNASKNFRIAHIMAGAANGGAELFFERLCIAQHQQQLSVLPIIRKNLERRQKLIEAGLNPVELPFGGLMDWSTKKELKKVLMDFSPKVAIAWMNRAASFMPRGEWISVGRLGGFYDLKYYKHCDHLVGNTKGIVQWIKKQGWPEHCVHYVPNFARTFPVSSAKRPDYIPDKVPFILALGRLHVNKGFDILIKAMPYLKNVHVVIAGEGEERERLENLARALNVQDRVHMPGWVKDISSLIQACDILVCSSRHEPLGNIVLEGFSANKPVVALAAQGPVELIENGKNGLLTPLEDEKALANAIESLIADSNFAHKLAIAGCQTFKNEFSQSIVLQKWYDFLTKIEKT